MGIQILPSLIVSLCISYVGVHSAQFNVINNCPYTIWPATLTGKGSAVATGFELAPKASKIVDIPTPWSGRMWARTNSGGTGTPPASLAEFTLADANGKDFFDISLVDGFNLPLSIRPEGAGCPTTTCSADINRGCPNELAVKDQRGGVIGCKSACLALNQPQYCCTGAFGTPETCKPSTYSQIFKRQCPQAYSYAYDDRTSTFTCPTGGNYLITFCP